jgi:DNA helicase II / ATP-dependent DNA helicase PcrA
MEFLKDLNPNQYNAATHIAGPMMVIAGAGSGKTKVLTSRIAYLIENGVDAFNILALTFTNKAAREMKNRIASVVGESEAKNVTMGTFHSVFARILRHHAERLGYPSNFTIYDTQDSKSLIKAIVKEMGLDDKIYKPGVVMSRISSAKNNLISAAQYEQNAEIIGEDRMSAKPQLFHIYRQYEQRCFKASAMDFDDLLFKTNLLLRDHPDVLQYYQHRFQFILVDEYQDTNYSQYLIVKKLAAVNENLCVVGDDAQSIYAFRGANIENILNFEKDYPDYKLYKLEQNYRSTKNIVEAANSIIANNKNQIKKEVWTQNDTGNKIKVVRTLTDNEEGRWVANSIYDNKQASGEEYAKFAILYRTNAQSRAFEEALRKLNIPYRIYGGLSFYQRKEIKDLIAYFRLICNPNDEEAFKRVINYPKRGIGDSTIDTLFVASQNYQVSLWELIENFHQYPVNLNGGAKSKIEQFVMMINRYRGQLETHNAADIAEDVSRSSGISKLLYEDKSPEGVARHENIQELLAGIKEFSDSGEEGELRTLSDFLLDVALLTDADDEKDKDTPRVSLMTIHASKGLEFPNVYIVGLEENLFPSQMALHSRADLEEERRLFYVALTRAERKCTLSYSMCRYLYGRPQTSEPSRFIQEIDPAYLDIEVAQKAELGRSLNLARPVLGQPTSGLSSGFKSVKQVRPMNDHLKKNDQIKVGHVVLHEKFGKGKVLSFEGDGSDKKVKIFFAGNGEKTLLLKFAKLDVVG